MNLKQVYIVQCAQLYLQTALSSLFKQVTRHETLLHTSYDKYVGNFEVISQW